MRKTIVAIAVFSLSGCPRVPQIAYTTSAGIEVVKTGTAPSRATLEQWTRELAHVWMMSPCEEFHVDILQLLQYSAKSGLPARVVFSDEKMSAYGHSTGRFISVGPIAQEHTYKHELTHALIDSLRLASWDAADQHALMQRCSVP